MKKKADALLTFYYYRSKEENIEWVRTWTEDFKTYLNYDNTTDFYEFITDDYNFR